MKIEDSPIGTVIETNLFTILFGNINSNSDEIKKLFPEIKLKRIKQVHGDQVIHTSPHAIDFSREADAHYTNEKNVGLGIATADCIPVMLFHENPRWIVSIHAGWRGVQNRIVPKSISQLIKMGCAPENISVFAGPHIQKPSFEVGNDVRDQLLVSIQRPDPAAWSAINEAKSRVDLNWILKSQLLEMNIEMQNCFFEMKDTVADQNYHSFRRDKQEAGRQISLIFLK
jgi:YfiH family protein